MMQARNPGRLGAPARLLCGLVACCGILCATAAASRAAYPDRPVHLLVGFAPGGGTDLLARLLGKQLSEAWAQPVIVENREGGDGTIAEGLTARAAPDGYTIVIVPNPHTITPAYMKLNYDPVKSFSPITLLVQSPDLLLVNPAYLSVTSVKDLIALAKSKPGQLNFSSAGPSSPNCLEMDVFMKGAGIDMVNVSYKGGTGAAVVGLMGGEVQSAFASVAASGGQIAAGKLKPLAVSGSFRLPAYPEVPTMAEAANLPAYDETVWDGILAPAGLPDAIVAKLHDDIVAALKTPDLDKALRAQGYFPVGNTPQEFAAFIDKDIAKWTSLVKSLDLKP
jgi:tripartite-type tricarboxylate transporter receptor subunit TctC